MNGKLCSVKSDGREGFVTYASRLKKKTNGNSFASDSFGEYSGYSYPPPPETFAAARTSNRPASLTNRPTRLRPVQRSAVESVRAASFPFVRKQIESRAVVPKLLTTIKAPSRKEQEGSRRTNDETLKLDRRIRENDASFGPITRSSCALRRLQFTFYYCQLVTETPVRITDFGSRGSSKQQSVMYGYRQRTHLYYVVCFKAFKSNL